MGRKIWIMNHYAGNIFFAQGGRHYYFAKELKKQGYEPLIFCCNVKHGANGNYFEQDGLWQEHYTNDGFAFVFIRSTPYTGNGKQRIKNMLVFAKNLCTTAKQYAKKYGKPDVILASSVHPFTVLAGEHIAKKLKVPCICEIRDLWPESIVSYKVAKNNSFIIKAMYRLERYLYNKAQAIIFTMEGGKDYIIEKGWDKEQGGKIDLTKVYHINNGVDLELFDHNKEKYSFADSDLDNPSTFKVIYAGSIRPANNLSFLLDVAEYLQTEKDNPIRILIFGDGEERVSLEQQCKERGIYSIVFKGKQNKNTIPYILSKGDFCLLNYQQADAWKYGGSQNKLFEYFASGTPIITNVKIGYCLISRYECGVIEQSNLPEVYADTLRGLAGLSVADLNIMRKNARRAVQDYNFKNLTNRLLRVIDIVTKEKEMK